MLTPILATKLYIPPLRSRLVRRPRLVAQLNAGLQEGPAVALISAAAGSGKTTLLSEWAYQNNDEGERIAARDEKQLLIHPSAFILHPFPIAWLALDEGDNDPARFLAYLVSALQTIAPGVGAEVLGVLGAPQALPVEAILTSVLNDLAQLANPFALVLDDYHLIETQPVNQAVIFLLEHLPPQMRLVIATREDPPLPLARLRARDRLIELREADLRFGAAEAAAFLNEVMGLQLAAAEVEALEQRTEGWIAGLQLAAIALRGPLSPPSQRDVSGFIQAFTGSHHFVLDYLLEEVWQQQTASIQNFLLRTSILNRLCGPLCDAVLQDPAAPGQATLEAIERANLFILPLDNERRWYRYHHLFAELLRQRLAQSLDPSGVNELHIRASQWYEDHGLDIEAFHHAAAAQDIPRAERLIEGQGIPLHLRGAVLEILAWLGSLPVAVLNARPALWWRYGSLLLVSGQSTGVDEKLQAAEAALPAGELDAQTRNLVGRIAAARATLALTRYQADAMLAQSQRALEFLDPKNLGTRANAHWTLGYAHLFKGERAPARQAFVAAIALCQTTGDIFTSILAMIGLGNVQEADNQLHPAAETYQQVLHIAGDQPLQIVGEAHLGLARIFYEWNDLAGAEQHGQLGLALARQYDRVIDRFILHEVFLARVALAAGDVDGAAARLSQTEQSARQKNFAHRLPEVAAAQVCLRLRQGQIDAAAQLAQAHPLPESQARVCLAQGDPAAALAALEPRQQQVAARGWEDERLKLLVLQALALQAAGAAGRAMERLGQALALAEPGGFVRLFVDEGPPMAQLLAAAAARGVRPTQIGQILAAFPAGSPAAPKGGPASPGRGEPLSPRELEILQRIAQGLSNQEIAAQLFLALDTVKGHNRRIFEKLGVQRRTEAVARARELGWL